MKRLIAVLAVLCLLLGSMSVASAAITITRQPETQTVKAGKTAKFSFKAKGASGLPITWYFTNPETGETTTGKKLPSVVKGVRVSNPNSPTIILKKVPEEMHGWRVHCHVGKKSSGVDTDEVLLLIAGLEVPDSGSETEGEETSEAKEKEGSEAETAAGSEENEVENPEDKADEESETGKSEETESEDGETEIDLSEMETGETESEKTVSAEPVVTPEPVIVYVTPEPVAAGPVVITAAGKTELYRLDSKGQITGSAEKELTFEENESANFYVKIPDGTEGTIQYVTIGGVRLTPEGEVTGMSIRGWETSASVKIKIDSGEEETELTPRPKSEETDLDETNLVEVTCTNCRFTGWHSSFAQSGQVPVGATITVIADGGWLKHGYTINGVAKQYKDKASFQMVVEENTAISMELQP